MMTPQTVEMVRALLDEIEELNICRCELIECIDSYDDEVEKLRAEIKELKSKKKKGKK